MSHQATFWAANMPHDLVGYAAFRTLMILADNAKEDGSAAWIKLDTLASRLKVSRRTIERAFKELQLNGMIRPGDERHVAHLRADHRPKVWDLTMSPYDLLQKPLFNDPSDLTPRHNVSPRGDSHDPTSGVATEHGRTTHISINSSQRTSREHVGSSAREARERPCWDRWAGADRHLASPDTDTTQPWRCIRCDQMAEPVLTLSETLARIAAETAQ